MSVGAVNKQTGDRIPTAGMPAVDSVLSGTSTNPVQNKVVKEALDEKANTDMVAADFNAGSSYTAGNYCVQDGKLYKFKNNHSGAWSSADVDEVKITGELSALRSGLTSVETLQTITPDALRNGDITIKRTCGAKFVLCHNMILKNDMEAGATVELCATGTVLNPPTEDTVFPIYAKSSGNSIAPVNLLLGADGSIIVTNFASVATKLYGYCCGAYI